MQIFAACAPGLEPWLVAELTALGMTAPRSEAGGAEFEADERALFRVALSSGLATALRVRMGTFVASRFEQLVRSVEALDWSPWVRPGDHVEVKATSRKSRLYHTTAIAERVVAGVERAVGGSLSPKGALREWTVLVRLLRDRCVVSLDVTGAPLYRRGYRLATAKAPLRPDLAHALLQVSGWDRRSALVDPFCGAGTICIEAAAMARSLPPGRLRTFGFMQAPGFDESVWRGVRDELVSRARMEAPAPILGSDRDAGAVDAAKANAERAGVAVEWEHAPLGRASSIRRTDIEAGMWISNPPFGARVGDVKKLRHLYQSIGAARGSMIGAWRLALAVADPRLGAATGVPLESKVMTDHGGTKIRLMVEEPSSVNAAASEET